MTTLDVLSGGRAWLGIGAGYHEEEACWMGLPLPPTRERFEHLEHTLRLALQMWAGDQRAFDGRHHQLERPSTEPRSDAPMATSRRPSARGSEPRRRRTRSPNAARPWPNSVWTTWSFSCRAPGPTLPCVLSGRRHRPWERSQPGPRFPRRCQPPVDGWTHPGALNVAARPPG
ncbi:LLM class flavin-dependent oxidoreductase [Actinopolymorpha sp. NPDC004070]|uniref:LLM class flavin-dependent oxidoreductase n=1 Tax=Actinopolymorpha sp. NPDC004070 TaxID=3154548 RepID=UPI0033BA6543